MSKETSKPCGKSGGGGGGTTSTTKPNPHQQYHRLLILHNDVDEESSLDFNHDPTATVAMVLTAWLRRRRRRNLLLLALFSPLLLPFLCAAFPLLCALELCLRLRRRRRRRRRIGKPVSDGLGRCEEGRGEFTESEVGGEVRVLLQRYLEDQLVLVVGSVYDCDDDDDFCSGDDLLEDCDCFDSLNPV